MSIHVVCTLSHAWLYEYISAGIVNMLCRMTGTTKVSVYVPLSTEVYSVKFKRTWQRLSRHQTPTAESGALVVYTCQHRASFLQVSGMSR